MGENTTIEWATHSWNPWTGCTKVSEGCAHCYAESWAKRSGIVQWGPGQPRRRTSPANWKEPLKWDRAEKLYADASTDEQIEGKANGFSYPPPRPRVFCASLADWLDDEVPVEWLADLLELIMRTPNLDWLLLTKRPQNWRGRMQQVRDHWLEITPCGSDACSKIWWLAAWIGNTEAPNNVWIGTTVENQARADERIPHLLKIPARVRFLSCEPLLGPVSLSPHLTGSPSALHWVIGGGESGPGARPMHPDWARGLRDQCTAAGVPFLFKQWGEWLPSCQYRKGDRERFKEKAQHSFCHDHHSWWVGKKNAGRLLDGREWNEFPKVERRDA